MSGRGRTELVRDLLGSGRPYQSPGARKEKLRERAFRRGGSSPLPYAELRVASAFSFLDGASLPEDLVARAAELGLPAVALVDRNGVYAAPRFFQAAKAAGLRPLVGAEVTLDRGQAPLSGGRENRGQAPLSGGRENRGQAPLSGGRERLLSRSAENGACPLPRITLLAESRTGYRNLCQLLTAAAAGKPKGEARARWDEIAAHAEGLHLLTGGDESPLARLVDAGDFAAARALAERWAHAFPGRVHVELQRHGRRAEERRNRVLVDLARRLRLPLLATGGVRFARADDKPLFDVLTAIRHRTTLDAAGALLAPNRERHLQGAAEMARRFADLPEAIVHAGELSERLAFTLDDLGYRFPDYPLPPGETPASSLRELVWSAARARFRPLSAKAQAQLAKELALVEKLDLAGYFLIVRDIVEFCRRERILCQGRGSAANSAVCYALGITAVDPVKMDLLFERFLSEERGEWPDIDLDLPSGDQREKVIQYVFRRYGAPSGAPSTTGGHPVGAAMTANVITYRDRSAAREVGKALGFSAEQIDALAKQLGTFRYDLERGDPKSFEREVRAAGFDPEERRIRLFGELWRRIQNLPRHLGQHAGGMVIAKGRLDEIVPLEPAAMPGRTVVQWDKDDCADLGIIKIDLLGLGMLNALERTLPLVRAQEGVEIDLAHLPPDDPAVYAMLRAADTVGVFQVESRAQMASLPRNAPARFYDLVIQVAIIRPGPITGGMVHPFFERRRGREPVSYFHPCLEPILARTLGVPIFQEQLLRMAMAVSGFTGGEAEELRRAMGFKRSVERMQAIERKLRDGMSARGIVGETQDQIVQSITSFALYGFPESHAASFALIAYASAYLKAHHPTAFLIGLLDAWPMGFYHPASLVQDAQRHGVTVLPIDVDRSRFECTWEASGEAGTTCLASFPEGPPPKSAPGACRLGLRFVGGLRRGAAERIVAARDAGGPYRDADDLARRTGLRAGELETLASIGALASLGATRREALWQVALAVRPAGDLFDSGTVHQTPNPPVGADAGSVHPTPDRTSSNGDPKRSGSGRLTHCMPLPEMTAYEETVAEFEGTGLTTGPHPLAHFRASLARRGVIPAAELQRRARGARVRIAGAVIVRQRPGTAKGTLFLTLEDESGMAQAIVAPALFQAQRATIVGHPGLVVEGTVEEKDGSVSLRAEKFWPLRRLVDSPSHDFR
jgi:error-prone DNA polymerase